MSKRLGLKIAKPQAAPEEEEEPMSPTLTKVVEMERERDEVLEAMEQGEFDEEDEMEVLHQIAQLQQQIEDLMKKRMKRLKGKGKARSPSPEPEPEPESEEEEEPQVEVTLADDDDEDPTDEGEEPVGALANGEVWVFAAVNLDTGDLIAAHAPENWMEDKGFKRRVTLVAGTVKVSRSKTSGKHFPSKVVELEMVRKVKRDVAIEWFEDHLDEEGFTEFNDKKGNNYVIKLLEKAESA